MMMVLVKRVQTSYISRTPTTPRWKKKTKKKQPEKKLIKMLMSHCRSHNSTPQTTQLPRAHKQAKEEGRKGRRKGELNNTELSTTRKKGGGRVFQSDQHCNFFLSVIIININKLSSVNGGGKKLLSIYIHIISYIFHWYTAKQDKLQLI